MMARFLGTTQPQSPCNPVSAYGPAGKELWPGNGMLQRGTQRLMLAEDAELLDLWDNIWFGLSCSPSTPQAHIRAKFPADPLDNVLPAITAAEQPLLRHSQQHDIAMFHAAQFAAAALPFEHHLQHQRPLHHLQHSVLPGGSPAALAVPAQPTSIVNGASPIKAHTRHKAQQQQRQYLPLPDNALLKATKEQQQQQPQQMWQREQQPEGPAPYVLGTWAERQFLMPVCRLQQSETNGSSSSVVLEQRSNKSSGASSSSGKSDRTHGQPTTAADAASGGSCQPAPAQHQQLNGDSPQHASAAATDVAGADGMAVDATAAAMLAAHCAVEAAPDDDEDAVMQAAWRWRFAKRWQAEQSRPPLDPAASVGDGGMEEALQYLAACGENWHLARTASADAGCASGSRLTGTLGTPPLLGPDLLVEDSSLSAAGSGRGGGLLQSTGSGMLSGFLSREASSSGLGRGEATRQVTGITKRAAQLLAAQSDINKAVTERWREVQAGQGCELWVGALLECVEVDDWGKFKWLLLRLKDRSGRQKLLVRGANYASDAKIVEGLHRQMMAACAAHDVCAEAIEVIGGGVMEWRRHRDRHLHILNGYVTSSSGPGGPATAAEVMNLAAVLTKQHLPMHYRVTSEGGKVL